MQSSTKLRISSSFPENFPLLIYNSTFKITDFIELALNLLPIWIASHNEFQIVTQGTTITPSIHHNLFYHSQSVSGVCLIKKQNSVDFFSETFILDSHRLSMKYVPFYVFVSGAAMDLVKKKASSLANLTFSALNDIEKERYKLRHRTLHTGLSPEAIPLKCCYIHFHSVLVG